MAKQKRIIDSLKETGTVDESAKRNKKIMFSLTESESTALTTIAKKYGTTKQFLIQKALENEGLLSLEEVN